MNNTSHLHHGQDVADEEGDHQHSSSQCLATVQTLRPFLNLVDKGTGEKSELRSYHFGVKITYFLQLMLSYCLHSLPSVARQLKKKELYNPKVLKYPHIWLISR